MDGGAGAAEEGKTSMAKPEGCVKKKTKLVRVDQSCIDALLEVYPKKPFVGVPEEHIQLLPPEERERFRTFMAQAVACVKKGRDEDEAILEQYRTKGYAEMEVEVREEDDDGKEEEEGHYGRRCSLESKL